MNKRNCLIVFLLGTLLSSCSDGLSPQEYAAWVEDPAHGLVITKDEKNYQFTLNYKPIEYIVALQLRKSEISTTLLKEETEKMKDMQYYTLRMSTKDGHPVFSDGGLNFPEKEIYLLSGIQQDICLLEGKDTIHCKLFHFEGANGLLPYDNCVMGFDKTAELKKDKTLLYKADKLGMDWVRITIKADDINRIPKLKTI
jgi:hypothetical protein